MGERMMSNFDDSFGKDNEEEDDDDINIEICI